MNSFDVFDTLIARRYITSEYIWKQLEKEFQLDQFSKLRPVPDNGTKTFLQIYEELAIRHNFSKDLIKQLMNRELELEIENSFPIQENMDRVVDGDILISDMYLSGPDILQLVRSSGLNKQLTIYQSNGDKSNGNIWKKLKNNPPALHLGDNQNSDYVQPKKYNINAELTTHSKLSNVEEFLIKRNHLNLALLVREIRLINNFSKNKEYFNLACQLNIPLIFVMLEQLHRKHKDRPIVFLGRDCQLMWKIYNSYYGIAYYLPFSRKVAYNQPELAVKYLELNIPQNGILIDISSTGETWTFLANYKKFDIQAVIYSDETVRNYLPDNFQYITKNSECGKTNLILEIMNCGDHGYLNSLVKLDDTLIKTNFVESDLPYEIIEAVHTPVYDAVALVEYYKDNIRKELSTKTDLELFDLFKILSSNICSQLHLLNNLLEFKEKEHTYHEQILSIRKQLEKATLL